ncbi:MAG: prepilin-type N-terminal cleavage/methylation domain-containing protein [Vicinamibacteria bacterium]|jgi:general secretion pathway protein G|nr:prepilin-type N-terminal cleavage/methylation domain-containing protein [Vicinamibacteria bacterium]MBP9947874.1 prepilin-type N-terminal cleavage/methylation domain-containing protein [Vicinamibacteria bacterium]
MPVRRSERGTTFIEVLAVAAIIAILAAAVLPLSRVTRQRQKELELRRTLRELRGAVDRFKDAVDRGQVGGTDVKLGSEGYPESLETLVEGVNQVGRPGVKLRFMRRIPVDPFTGKAEWGMRCYQDEPDSSSWCGDNVYDVYTLAEGSALDGTKLKDW